MDPVHSPDGSDVKPSFRKPSNDTASRKYRRYSPIGRSDSSSSDGGLKRESSPAYPVNDRNKMSDDRRRKNDAREPERESNRHRSSRVGDSHRHSARSPYENSHNYRRHSDDHGRHERYAGEEDRSYHRSTRSGRESRIGTRNDNARHDDSSDRYRDNWREMKYTRERSDNSGHMHKDKEIETMVSDHRRRKDRDSERTVSGNKAFNSSRDDVKSGEREYRNRDAEDAKKDRYKSSGYKTDHVSHDPVLERDTESPRSKETHRNSGKENSKTEDLVQKRKHNERETDKRKDKYTGEAEEEIPYKSSSVSSYRERDGRSERYIDRTSSDDQYSAEKKIKTARLEASDEKPSSSSKQAAGTSEIIASKPVNSVSNHADAGNGLDAAKVAAIKAAELVNKNLVGGAYLSTDQKKKLLWGNKKNTAAEEVSQPGNRWDIPLFADRERQEKFNKLMGVKGEAAPERKLDDKDVEKQRELLNMDLEKQYTAGLRRRDGRTVGLGL